MLTYKHATEKAASPLPFMLFFPALLLYYESLFHLFTAGGFSLMGALLLLLFSAAYGGLLYLAVTAFRHRTVTTALTAAGILLPAVLYLVEYFVHRQFKNLYDVNTVIHGASDAMGGFGDVALSLVFSLDGLFKIFLYFLPLILFFVFRKRLDLTANLTRRLISVGYAVLCYGLSLVLIFTSSVYAPMFSKEYNFTAAVNHFGLLTGVGLDIKKVVTGSGTHDFEQAEPDSSLPAGPADLEEEIVYGLHQLELNLGEGSGDIAKLNSYVASLTPARENAYTGLFRGKNLIFITAEAFTAEVIDPVLTPTLYRLATKGIQFTDYYQPSDSGTTGGEYQNLFGMLPSHGGSSFKETASHYNYMTIGSQLNRLGYYGKAFHNNSYTYYSRHQTHINLGYSDGFMGYGNGMEAYVKNSWPQSDKDMLAGTLPTYIDKQPFNVYYMSVSGHSNYSRVGNSMTAKNWERVAHLPYSDDVKGYLAANLELEDALALTVAALEEKGIADDTVICISTDHFPYGLDKDAKLGGMPNLSELYGYTVTTRMERDHNRLILWSGCLEDAEPIVVDSPTSSLDILPTLSNLFGTEYDSRLFPGRDVFSDTPALVFNSTYDWKTDLGTYNAADGVFTPKEGVTVPENYVADIKAQVRNKIQYCSLALETDYFRYLFDR